MYNLVYIILYTSILSNFNIVGSFAPPKILSPLFDYRCCGYISQIPSEEITNPLVCSISSLENSMYSSDQVEMFLCCSLVTIGGKFAGSFNEKRKAFGSETIVLVNLLTLFAGEGHETDAKPPKIDLCASGVLIKLMVGPCQVSVRGTESWWLGR